MVFLLGVIHHIDKNANCCCVAVLIVQIWINDGHVNGNTMEGHVITSEIRSQSCRFEFCKWPRSPFTAPDTVRL